MHRPGSDECTIPRTIWSLWLQGWDHAPDIVTACRRTWEALNPAWSFQPLTRASLSAVLDERTMRFVTETPALPPEALSDVVRIALLERHGGVWADGTSYCLKPLDAWLPGATAATGFFAFAKPGPDRMISSWFLAAAPGNVLVKRWAERTRAYWTGRSARDEYFWFHYLFGAGYDGDAEWRTVWDATPEILACGAHRYEPYDAKLWAPVTHADRQFVDEPTTPVLKLSHKISPGTYPERSVIRYLCDRALRVHA
ncbi:MAG TPA: capsular polysaccharide synthesis protein [Candidatus Elarobacter sp.]|nr:capsular polysaccharide synthesis protein [Candidatus Elarobacter sp.]